MTRWSVATPSLSGKAQIPSVGGMSPISWRQRPISANTLATRYARRMAKRTRTAHQLQQILLERIEALPGMAGQVTDVHRAGVRWVDAGEGAPNWTVPAVTDRGAYRSDVARVIAQAQMEFDLDVD